MWDDVSQGYMIGELVHGIFLLSADMQTVSRTFDPIFDHELIRFQTTIYVAGNRSNVNAEESISIIVNDQVIWSVSFTKQYECEDEWTTVDGSNELRCYYNLDVVVNDTVSPVVVSFIGKCYENCNYISWAFGNPFCFDIEMQRTHSPTPAPTDVPTKFCVLFCEFDNYMLDLSF